MRMSSEDNWRVYGDDKGCTLRYYHRDHPDDVRNHGVNVSVSFLYLKIAPAGWEAALPKTLFPVDVQFVAIRIQKALIDPLVRNVRVVSRNKELARETLYQQDQNYSAVQLSEDSSALAASVLATEGKLDLVLNFEDGYTRTLTIVGDGWRLNRAMFKTCIAESTSDRSHVH